MLRIARIPRHRHPREDVGVVECGLIYARKTNKEARRVLET